MATKTYDLKTIGDETIDAIHAKLNEVRQIVSDDDYEFICQQLIVELVDEDAADET